jgi:hypothetical protein
LGSQGVRPLFSPPSSPTYNGTCEPAIGFSNDAANKFMDGTIKAITAQGLVIVQEVNDPLSLVKQREIRKLLRSAEGAKP